MNTLMTSSRRAPEHADKLWLCSVLKRASSRRLIHQPVFWCQGGDGEEDISLDRVSLVAGGEHITSVVISSHRKDSPATPYAPKWFSNGQEERKWLSCSQSIALLQLRNPAGWYHSYFIPGKDYLSGLWEMYWSVFLFPPAITWQRHLGGEWMSDTWSVSSGVVASSVHWWVERWWEQER